MADPDPSANKTPIIMKVDAPSEDEDNKANDEAENNTKDLLDIKPAQICSPVLARPILASPRFATTSLTTTNSGSSSSSNSSVLRPPQLATNSTGSGGFLLNPSRLNPFASGGDAGSEEKPAKTTLTTATTTTTTTTNNVSHTNGETPKFVPLLQSENSKTPVVVIKPVTTAVPTTSISQASNFVFGQNLEERVIADNKTDEPKPSTSLNSNGTVDMLFTNAANKAEVANNVAALQQNKEGGGKSLSESAREYEESRAAVKRKFEEVEVITGEEGETNVLQVGCKLFAFDKASGSWQERGQGNLRLNDFEVKDDEESYTQSRLVFRTVGGLRVILNTKVWAEMTVQEASQKSVRFTAIDGNGEIKVYLVMANKEKIQQLYTELTTRVRKEIERQKNKKKATTQDGEENCAKKEKLDTTSDN